jgi:hypothetical protein
MYIDVQRANLVPQFRESPEGTGHFHWENWDFPVEKQCEKISLILFSLCEGV